MSRRVQEAWGHTLEQGYNDKLTILRQLFDRLQYHYRPLVFYVLMELLAVIKHVTLTTQGFRCVGVRNDNSMT